MYVLFGSSGSGKTTLLNTLLGLNEFENGDIIFNGKKYTSKVSNEDISSLVGYVAQDSFFIDYLTVKENIIISCPSVTEKEIITYMDRFKLTDKLLSYPNQLSGGERQRLSLIQSLLKNKKILFLDEPTASLDRYNRDLFFDIISNLKNEMLIICASHDEKILDYCDEKLDFNKKNFNKKVNTKSKKAVIDSVNNNNSFSLLFKYMLKQFKYKSREKKSDVFLIVILIVSLLLIFGCFDYKEKLLLSLVDKYDVNYVKIHCSVTEKDNCTNALEDYDYSSLAYIYAENVPPIEPIDAIDGGIYESDFDPTYLTLPFNRKDFSLSNSVFKAGSYFNSSEQIVLGYSYAYNLNHDVSKLIGTKYELSLPDMKQEFTIIGVLNPLVYSSKTYFASGYGDIDFDSYVYLNSKYTDKYLHDNVLGYNELGDQKATVMFIYFDDSKQLYDFYKENIDNSINDDKFTVDDFIYQFSDYYQITDILQILIPIIVSIMIIISILFYFQIKKTEISYQKHILSVYQYYGYKWSSVKKANEFIFMFTIAIKYLFSLLLTILISNILNVFIGYNFFLVDWNSIILLFISLILITYLLSYNLLRKMRVVGWLNILKKRSDLL